MAAPTQIARYEVQSRIGRGGMGSLYLARDPKIDRLVAIKLLNADLDRDDLRIRFDREARSAGALNHPNIVTIFDYGVHDDAPYIVMEYIRGETLAEIIRRRATLPVPLKVGLIEQLCRGLGYAHDAGIIHRDIKPANLMVDQHGVLKILDFGIARLAESGLTQVSVSIGTPGYMSPEQIQGRTVERPSDMFSVGAVAYELLTYQAAFAGDTQHAILNSVLHDTPPPIASIVDLDPRLIAIVDRALQKAAADRYPDAASLQRDLQSLGQMLGPLPRTPIPPEAIPTRRFTPIPGSETPTTRARPSGAGTGIDTLLNNARQAFAAGEPTRALFLIDRILENEPRQPDALELQRQIEDARLADLLGKARAGIDHQRLTEASDLVAQALKMRPRSEAVLRLRSEIEDRRQDVERQATNRTRAKIAIERGKLYLSEEAWDAARRSFDEALALDPGNAEARDLREMATGATERGYTRPSPQPRPVPVAPTPTTVHHTDPTVVLDAPPRKQLSRSLLIGLAAAGIVIVIVVGVVIVNSFRTTPPIKNPPPPPPPPVSVDNVSPTVRFLTPSTTGPMKGRVNIKVDSTDDRGVISVQAAVDGTPLGAALTTPPYSWEWTSASLPDGEHRIEVESRDAAGNVGRASRSVTVRNQPATPPIHDPPPVPPAADVKAAAMRKGDQLLGKKDCAGALAAANGALNDSRLKDDKDLLQLKEDALSLMKMPGACGGRK